ncbi:MAG: hypothetical protein NTY65_03620 [Planctomycetota bacterium]|nr:hypothetical protein [Planctomycetota bacterium]
MAEWKAAYAEARTAFPALAETMLDKAAEGFMEEVPWRDPQSVAQWLKVTAMWLTSKASAFAWRTGDSEIAGMYAKARKYQEDWRTVLKKRFPNSPLPELPRLAGNDFYAGMFNLADYCNLIADTLDGPGKEEAGDKAAELSKVARALAALTEHPDWTDEQIADAAGCCRESLYRMKKFMAAKALLKEGKHDVAGGSKSKEGGVEAWERDKNPDDGDSLDAQYK